MATCVKCKKEIDSTLAYCPYCGSKQNMHIDINQVVSKDLIGKEKFDKEKDITKTPRVEIIIDASDAATPMFPKDEKGNAITRLEELPNPKIKEADISDYKNDIEVALFNDVSERMINASKEKDVLEEEIKKADRIAETSNEVAKSKKINIANAIINLLIGGAIIFFVGFVYFYQGKNMLFISTLRFVKNNLETFTKWKEYNYACIFGIFCLIVSAMYYLAYLVMVIVRNKNLYVNKKHNFFFGLSLAFALLTLYFNAIAGYFKFDLNYLFHFHSYLIIALAIICLFINMILRLIDPLNLSFKWGHIRYDLENPDCLPKLYKMNRYLSARKILYIFICILLLLNIYLIHLINVVKLPISNYSSSYAYIIWRYAIYKSRFAGSFNIFQKMRNVIDSFYVNGYSFYIVILSICLVLAVISIVANEFISHKKNDVVKTFSSTTYIISYIFFLTIIFKNTMSLISLTDGNGVNNRIDPLLYGVFIARIVSNGLMFLIMLIERCVNRNIKRQEPSIYKERE